MSPICEMGQRCSMLSLLPNGLGSKEECHILIQEIALRAIQAFEQKHFKDFDANAADSGCQNQAMNLRRLAVHGLNQDFQELKRQLKEINMTQIFISDKMEYLLHCYLLKLTRVVREITSEGVKRTISDKDRLCVLSNQLRKAISKSQATRIIRHCQSRLSHLSLKRLRDEMRSLHDPLVQEMLSESAVCIFNKKAFGCLFFEIKAILMRLSEDQALVGLKKICVKKEEGFTLFFQPKVSQGPFELLPDEAYTPLVASSALVVIFEAVIYTDRTQTILVLNRDGFTQTILGCAAKDAPYHPKSTVNDVKNPEAKAEILDYAQRTPIFLRMDHVYLNTIEEEL